MLVVDQLTIFVESSPVPLVAHPNKFIGIGILIVYAPFNVSEFWVSYTHCSRTNAENVSHPFYHVNRILYSNISIIISGSSYNGSGCRGLWPPLLYCNSLMAHCYIYWERKSTIENSPVSGIVQLCYSPLSTYYQWR